MYNQVTKTEPRTHPDPSPRHLQIAGTAVFQGPNYALAKAMQMWRVIRARANGQTVSFNMAPPSRTESVVHSTTAAAGLEGMTAFRPIQAFDQAFVSGVMAALLLFDLISEDTTANPTTVAGAALPNPHALAIQNSFHGGGPRCAFGVNSVGASSYLLGRLGYSYQVPAVTSSVTE